MYFNLIKWITILALHVYWLNAIFMFSSLGTYFPAFFFKFCQIKWCSFSHYTFSRNALYLFQSCDVILRGGRGGLRACPPPVFFFHMLANEKWCSFSCNTSSWDALYLSQSSGTIFMWRGGGRGCLGGCPPHGFYYFFNYAKKKNYIHFHITHGHEMHCAFSCPDVFFSCGGFLSK